MSREPRQKPGRSEQVVRTPWEFLVAAKRRLGIEGFALDLAATKENAVARLFYTERDNALLLSASWSIGQHWSWLNPPYGRTSASPGIGAWLQRAIEERDRYGAHIAVLVPASTGANWWRDYVHGKARVLLLNGRVTFNDAAGKPICSPTTGKPTPFPKDLALLLYAPEIPPGYDVWSWKRP